MMGRTGSRKALRARALSVMYPYVEHDRKLSRTRICLTTIGVFFLVAVPCAIGYWQRRRVEHIGDWFKDRGNFGSALFLLFNIAWTVLCLPSTPLEITSALIFKFWFAWFLTCFGQLIGSIISFFIGRYCIRECLYRVFFRKYRFMRHLRTAFKKAPMRCSLLVAFSYTPNYVHNFSLAVLPCTFCEFFVATIASESIFSLIWTGVGASARGVVTAVDEDFTSSMTSSVTGSNQGGGNESVIGVNSIDTWPELVLMGVGLVVGGAFMYIIQRQATSELALVAETETMNAEIGALIVETTEGDWDYITSNTGGSSYEGKISNDHGTFQERTYV